MPCPGSLPATRRCGRTPPRWIPTGSSSPSRVTWRRGSGRWRSMSWRTPMFPSLCPRTTCSRASTRRTTDDDRPRAAPRARCDGHCHRAGREPRADRLPGDPRAGAGLHPAVPVHDEQGPWGAVPRPRRRRRSGGLGSGGLGSGGLGRDGCCAEGRGGVRGRARAVRQLTGRRRRMRVHAVGLRSGLDAAANTELAVNAVTAAADDAADLVVLPEYAARFDPRGVGPEHAEPLDRGFVPALQDVARNRGVAVIAGTTLPGTTVPGTSRAVNAVVAIDAAGTLVGAYRKVHLYDAFGHRESDRLEPGPVDAAPLLLLVGGFVVGVLTCYDLRFPESARRLVDAGADVLAVPAAWAAGEHKADHWRTLLRARAIENTAYVLSGAQHVGGALARAGPEQGAPVVRLVLTRSPGGRHREHVGAGIHQAPGRLREAQVVAGQHADDEPADQEQQRRRIHRTGLEAIGLAVAERVVQVDLAVRPDQGPGGIDRDDRVDRPGGTGQRGARRSRARDHRHPAVPRHILQGRDEAAVQRFRMLRADATGIEPRGVLGQHHEVGRVVGGREDRVHGERGVGRGVEPGPEPDRVHPHPASAAGELADRPGASPDADPPLGATPVPAESSAESSAKSSAESSAATSSAWSRYCTPRTLLVMDRNSGMQASTSARVTRKPISPGLPTGSVAGAVVASTRSSAGPVVICRPPGGCPRTGHPRAERREHGSAPAHTPPPATPAPPGHAGRRRRTRRDPPGWRAPAAPRRGQRIRARHAPGWSRHVRGSHASVGRRASLRTATPAPPRPSRGGSR